MQTVPKASLTLVRAAQAGEPAALNELITVYLPLLYNVVGRALDGHADVDDVVQETLLGMVTGLPSLRDPASFQSWLIAIAVRRVRNRIRQRQTFWGRARPLSEAETVAEADFTDLTILRLGLEGQQRDLAEAIRWLDDSDRELLSLWCLELMGELARADLLSALNLSPSHASVRLQRLRAQLDVARTVVIAVRQRARCHDLNEVLRGWNGQPSPLWRKRVARHIRQDCPVCSTKSSSRIAAEKILRSMLLTPIPLGLGGIWLAKATGAGAGSLSALAAHTGTAGSWLGHSFAAKPLVLAAAGLTIVTAGAGSSLYLWRDHHPRTPPPAVAAAPVPSTATSPPRTAATTPSQIPDPRTTSTTKPATKPTSSPRSNLYGTVIDRTDTAPALTQRPAPIPKRPQAGVTITASDDNDPRADVVSLIYRGQDVTYQGQGYIRIEYQLAPEQLSGPIAPPSWTGLKGKLFHVASGGGVRLDDPDLTGDPGATYLGNDQDGFDVLPRGAQQMWHFEYFYLNGTVTLNQNERGADYNLYVHLVSWKEMHDDLFTPPAADGPYRYGITRDNGRDTTPVPQYATRKSPVDPTTVVQLSHLTVPRS